MALLPMGLRLVLLTLSTTILRCHPWIIASPAHSLPRTTARTTQFSSASTLLNMALPLDGPFRDAVDIAQNVQPNVVLVSPKGVRNMTARGSGFVLHSRELRQLLSTSAPFDTDIDTDFEFDAFDSNTLEEVEERSFAEVVYIVTAAHVTPPGYTVQVSWSTSLSSTTIDSGSAVSASSTPQKFPATVVARNSTLDLALLKVVLSLDDSRKDDNNDDKNTTTSPRTASVRGSNRPGAGLFLSPTDLPPVGTLVFSHGYPASRLRGPAMTSGIVCGIADGVGLPEDESSSISSSNQNSSTNSDNTNKQEKEQQQFAQPLDRTVFVVTNAAMSGGMSGGPLVDSSGCVVGVNALIRPDLRALGNYAVSAWELRKFLQETRAILARTAQDEAALHYQERSNSTTTWHHVWLYNDRMNKKERVASILETIARLNATAAQQVMMEAHTTGRGLVGNFTSLERAVSIGQALRDQDLLVEWEAHVKQ